MSRRFLIGLVLAILAIVLVCAFGGRLASRFAPTPTPTPGEAVLEEAPITAEGVVVPVKWAELSFKTGGVLEQILVEEGEFVEEGEILAKLDTSELELAVQAAEDALVLAEAQLAQAKAGSRPEEIALAEAALDAAEAGLATAEWNLKSAKANLEKLKAGARPEEIAAAEARFRQAETSLEQVYRSYQLIEWEPGAEVSPLGYAWRQATHRMEEAKAQLDLVKAGATPEEIAVAETQVSIAQSQVEEAKAKVAQSKAQLELTRAGPRKEAVAIAEAQVKQAKTALERARLDLENAKLIAPFSATVVSIAAREGEVLAGGPIITLADLSEFQVETTDLDEWGAAKVRIGQRVKIRVNAFDDKVLTGKVSAIALRGILLATGETVYTVTIELDEQDPELRWGMTAKVEFI